MCWRCKINMTMRWIQVQNLNCPKPEMKLLEAICTTTLRILSKSDDKGNANPTYVRDTLPGSLKKEARKTVKAARKEFGETQDETKADNYWKQTRKRRRKSLNKKRAHNN